MSNKKRVLFLCTGNSARSQIAEGLVNHLWGTEWHAFSAGSAPTGAVHPLALKAMSEIGIDISSHRSKSLREFKSWRFDVVVTVCEHAAKSCAAWLGSGAVRHWALPDPSTVEGTVDQQLDAFREIRDRLRQELPEYLGEILN